MPVTRSYGADIFLPPDRRTIVTAPVGGTLLAGAGAVTAGMQVRQGQPLFRLIPHVAPERDLRPQLERDVEAAKTRFEAAQVRSNRSEQLLKEKAGSAKAAQAAREEVDLAASDLKAAQNRLDRFISAPLAGDTAVTIAAPRNGTVQNVQVNPGQEVPGGTALFEVADLSVIWIRVPVYAGELGTLDHAKGARIRGLSEQAAATGRLARPVAAPPSADAMASTVDLYFELPNEMSGDRSYRPGQRVSADLTLRGEERSLVVPWSSILHDATGGTWIYESIAPQTFTRRRVEVLRVSNSLAVLSRGPAEGAKIVADGAEELFGTEFGAGK
ncbi:MAG: efflux RND transporter periplasmic adaptor subunit [Methanothrix sp.]|nr:efflux RND transporter periplasmic adaptor subunit [Methanothrix sp.]